MLMQHEIELAIKAFYGALPPGQAGALSSSLKDLSLLEDALCAAGHTASAARIRRAIDGLLGRRSTIRRASPSQMLGKVT